MLITTTASNLKKEVVRAIEKRDKESIKLSENTTTRQEEKENE